MAPRKLLRTIAGVGAAGSLLVPLTANAQAAQAAQAAVSSREIRVSVTAGAPADGSRTSVAAPCNSVSRFRACQGWTVHAQFFEGRPPRLVGGLTATRTHRYFLNVKSRAFLERIDLRTTSIWGAAVGSTTRLAATCGPPCTARNQFPQGRVLRLGTTIRGRVNYTDKVRRFKAHNTASRYVQTVHTAGWPPGNPLRWRSPAYRCDDRFAPRRPGGSGGQRPGCVFPRFTPALTTMTRLTFIAPGIRRVQTRGPGHYGRPGSGHPLHFIADEDRAERNRNNVCRGHRPPTTLPPNWPPGQPPTCDEYPFATAKEGGTTLSARNRGITWVPRRENNRQGGLFTTFRKQQRLLDQDAFWVKV